MTGLEKARSILFLILFRLLELSLDNDLSLNIKVNIDSGQYSDHFSFELSSSDELVSATYINLA